jgi:hypothetical protein
VKLKRSSIRLAVLALPAFLTLGSGLTIAEDEVIIIEGTRIRGNQESPTILYLVPWQAPEVVALDTPISKLGIERALEPLERSEFKRLISYHEHFKHISPEPAAK